MNLLLARRSVGGNFHAVIPADGVPARRETTVEHMPITRQFLDWNKPALPAVADWLISRYAAADELDLSKVILVFPGRRAARRMLELLVQRGGAKWPAMIPPRMVTFNQFPELLYPQKLQLADDLTQLLVWHKALYAVPMHEISAAMPNRPDEQSVSAWMALCESLRKQHEELAADGMEFDEVHQKLAQSDDVEESDRWKALRRIQSEYLWQMDELKLWDCQAARLIAVQMNECRTDSDIILIGTVDMNRIIRQMLDQVADRVTSLIHAPESEANAFDDYGCVKPAQWEKRLLNIGIEMTRIADSPLDQARAAMQELASFGGCFRADDITVGVADDTMVPTLLQALADAGVEGQWPVGMEIRETRPYQLLTALALHIASARDELPADFATLSDLVRHPDVNDWIDAHLTQYLPDDMALAAQRTWLSELDQYTADHLQTAPGAMLGPAPRRVIVAEVCRAVESLLRCFVPHVPGSLVPSGPSATAIRKQLTLDNPSDASESRLTSQLEKRRPLSVWAEGALRILATIYGDRELRSDSPTDRGIVQCVTALQDLNVQLCRIPVPVMPLCSASQALQLLLKQIADGIVPPEANEDAIELLGWLELPLDDSPVLVLTGFNEGKVPESINSDAFMPNSLRTRLDLTDNRRRYARDAYALTSILHSRRRVVLIAGRKDVQGNPLAPSRLWFAADPKSLPDRVRRFYDASYVPVGLSSASGGTALAAGVTVGTHSTAPRASAPSLSELQTVPSPQLSGFIIPAPSPIPSAPLEIAVTAFREYLQCPYRYFLRRELKLRSVDDDVRELTAPAFGSLMHDVLKKFGESSVKDASTTEPIETFLLQELQRQSLTRFGRIRSATVSVQLQMLESRLIAFARWQAETCQEGWRIKFVEQNLVCDFMDAAKRPIRLIGRINRIDQHQQSHEWRVLDYKSSEKAEKPEKTHRSKDEWTDLQLPLYRLLVRSLDIRSNVQLGYVQLPGDLKDVGISLAEWTDEELIGAETRAREIAADIIDLKIVDVPTMDDLRYSEFSRICQDTVIDRNIPWLESWGGRSGTTV